MLLFWAFFSSISLVFVMCGGKRKKFPNPHLYYNKSISKTIREIDNSTVAEVFEKKHSISFPLFFRHLENSSVMFQGNNEQIASPGNNWLGSYHPTCSYIY